MISFYDTTVKKIADSGRGKGDVMNSHVRIEQDEAGYYVAEVPALPGCLSQGKTYDEAIANIKEAVEGWLEVMESKQSPDLSGLIEVSV
jgi:predicted RNase H-like HicB family nuclease